MSQQDEGPVDQATDQLSAMMGPTKLNVQAVHIMMLAAPFTAGMLSIVALVFAYINKSAAPDWLQSHYQALIRTFWGTVIGTLISIALMFFLIGFLGLVFLFFWWMIRHVQGLIMVSRDEPVANPESWGFLK